MKHILAATLLLFAFMANAQDDPGFFQPVTKISDQISITFGSAGIITCESETIYGEWESADKAVKCKHEWAYAALDEVNPSRGITNAVYCPCGCDREHIEARICSVCLRHERRVVTTVFREKQSEYQRLLSKKEKKHE